MTVAFSLCIAVLMIAVSFGLIWYARHTHERSAARSLTLAAQKLKTECVGSDGSADMKLLMEEEREDLRPEGMSLLVISPDGKIIVSSQSGKHLSAMLHGGTWRTARVSIGRDTVVVGLPWQHVEEELGYHALVLILLSIFVTIIAAIGAWVLVGYTLSPIALLARQADVASTDSLNVCLQEPSADAEIVGLVATLNGLLTRLAETAKAKGRFYSAASHELRTPLQALSGHLELALTRERTADEYKQVVKESYAQTRRLILLARNLLLLYQLDLPNAAPVQESGDLASVCRQAVSQYQPMIEERGLHVAARLPDGMTFTAPPTHMDILVRNLIENAVKYADAGSEITLELSQHSGARQLRVGNRSSSVEEWNEERLFEPFGRRDSSRNSRTGGTGLGLAICKAIATANRWDLDLYQESGRVSATLIIPGSR
jgi:signal transduction histidine kinase